MIYNIIQKYPILINFTVPYFAIENIFIQFYSIFTKYIRIT